MASLTHLMEPARRQQQQFACMLVKVNGPSIGGQGVFVIVDVIGIQLTRAEMSRNRQMFRNVKNSDIFSNGQNIKIQKKPSIINCISQYEKQKHVPFYKIYLCILQFRYNSQNISLL